MDLPSIEKAFAQTLEDVRLSRTERRALASVIEDADLDARELGVLRHRAFELARAALDTRPDRAVLDWLEEAVQLLTPDAQAAERTARAYFSPGAACPERIVALLERVRSRADICVFTITDDRITDAVIDAHARGVEIRVVTDGDKSTDLGSDIDRMARAGVSVAVDRSEKHMHHKFAVFDRSVVVTGSYNWTRSAATENEENLVEIGERSLVRSFLDEFEKLWRRFS